MTSQSSDARMKHSRVSLQKESKQNMKVSFEFRFPFQLLLFFFRLLSRKERGHMLKISRDTASILSLFTYEASSHNSFICIPGVMLLVLHFPFRCYSFVTLSQTPSLLPLLSCRTCCLVENNCSSSRDDNVLAIAFSFSMTRLYVETHKTFQWLSYEKIQPYFFWKSRLEEVLREAVTSLHPFSFCDIISFLWLRLKLI